MGHLLAQTSTNGGLFDSRHKNQISGVLIRLVNPFLFNHAIAWTYQATARHSSPYRSKAQIIPAFLLATATVARL